MNPEDYAKARERLGLSVVDWCKELGISVHAHKKYNAGIRPVPKMLELSIEKSEKIKSLSD